METKSIGNQQNLAYRLSKDMQQVNLEYSYRGNFNPSITDQLIALAELSLDEIDENLKIKKKVCYLMVEGLQNITRHQLEGKPSLHQPPLFLIQKNKSSYFIINGNLILNENIPHLKNHLEKINSLDNEDLREYYLEILKLGNFSSKGGAGLGLIEMARKSGSKLKYDFNPVDEKYSYFYLQTEVLYAKTTEVINIEYDLLEFENIRELHSIFDQENILLNYSGTFNQIKLLKILSIIEKQFTGSLPFRKKVISVMLEMLQNIVNHADNYLPGNLEGNYGFFSIGEKENAVILNSGNYIKNDRIPKFKQRLDFLNLMDFEELKDYYKEVMVYNQSPDANHNGLGIIDIMLYSKNRLTYSFYPVNEEFSFYSIQVKVDKQEQISYANVLANSL